MNAPGPRCRDEDHIRCTGATAGIAAAAGAGAGAVVLLMLTEGSEARRVAPETMGAFAYHRRTVDGRHAPVSARWRAAG